MIELIRRQFEVAASVEQAWGHLSRVERWPSWAHHISRIELNPPGEIGPDSTGLIHLRFGPRSAFRVTEHNLHRNWKWVGRFLWLTVHYDHVFEQYGEKTALIWTVACEGFAAALFGRLFALIYNRNLNNAIPRLVAEIEGRGS